MIKNKISLIVLSVLLAFMSVGCTDWLDIKPEGETVLDDYWQTESQADEVLSACYRGLILDNNVFRMIVWGELRSDNVVSGQNSSYSVQKIMDVDITPTNEYCNWASMYQVINYCNTVLHYAPGVVDKDKNFTSSDLHAMESEALSIRALCYFYLVRTFKNVPWIESPSIDDTQNYDIAQSSDTVVIQNIIRDLKTAQKYARVNFGNSIYDKARITLNAVNALLADVYLWDQQYTKCVEACNAVLSDNNLKLVKSDEMYKKVFYEGNSTESIFELNFDDNVQLNNPVRFLYGYAGLPNGVVSFSPVLGSEKSEYCPFNYKVGSTTESTKDIREKDFYTPAATGFYNIFKYAGIKREEDVNGNSTYFYRNTTSNWIVYRLSDVMLMKAEALTQLNRGEGDLQEALNMVNATYLRSNPGSDSLNIVNYSERKVMEKLVLRERQRELMFEGKRWFDLVRLARRSNTTTELLSYLSPKLSGEEQFSNLSVMNALYMPIYKYELEANPSLKQNPFYAETSSNKKTNSK
ncbi:RagB/SusD family nutrient uptake outer membrane protein [Parabacteroides sp. FAFU027]|uniref:RagB/SusD family nutrient uptake outer membrane protein n=1 Tax=Parabacteroides sp. FAFU027 TaxID=2922715 RepID=UPI001FAF8B61|nr:RagB/SusD family nutrient uptake outer membrane protein [Parabacteroides sp. FAFU027]